MPDDDGPYDAAAVRFVHGGPDRTAPVRVDEAVLAELEPVSDLAPLHNPRRSTPPATCVARHPDLPVVACFDTTFHATIPAAAATYALPREWNERWRLRRYGFHGLSHAGRRAAGRRAGRPAGRGAADGDLPPRRRCVAVRGPRRPVGRHHDGLHAAGGPGHADPQRLGRPRADAAPAAPRGRLAPTSSTTCSTGSPGSRGCPARPATSARSSRRAAAGRPGRARWPSTCTCTGWSARRPGMAAAAGGLDVLVFTGGVGEHAADLRAAVVDGLAHLGVRLDAEAQRRARGRGRRRGRRRRGRRARGPRDRAAGGGVARGLATPYVVVRSRTGRPMPAPISTSSATVLAEPCSEPAIREMVSSISVPPTSLAPARSIARVPSTPSLTQEVWMLRIRPCSRIRAIACTARLSRRVGPGRATPAR